MGATRPSINKEKPSFVYRQEDWKAFSGGLERIFRELSYGIFVVIILRVLPFVKAGWD